MIEKCPFCGGEGELQKGGEDPDPEVGWNISENVWVECLECRATGPNYYGIYGVEEKAIDAWNKREPLSNKT